MAPPQMTAYEYFMRTGQFPHLGRSPAPPWRYLGWLRLLAQRLHQEAAQVRVFPDRWGYYERTLRAGRLLDEPIPPVDFTDAHSRAAGEGLKNLTRCLEAVEAREGGWTSLARLTEWLAFGLGVAKEDTPLDDTTCEALYRTFDLRTWLRAPSDYLGAIAAERLAGGPNGFYPTPHSLCEVMVRMLFRPEDGDLRLKTVNEPCVGTGRLLLHASNHSLLLCGQDKDPQVLLMAKVNFAVYAPWALYGLPWARVAQALQEQEAAQRAVHGLRAVLGLDEAPPAPQPQAEADEESAAGEDTPRGLVGAQTSLF